MTRLELLQFFYGFDYLIDIVTNETDSIEFIYSKDGKVDLKRLCWNENVTYDDDGSNKIIGKIEEGQYETSEDTIYCNEYLWCQKLHLFKVNLHSDFNTRTKKISFELHLDLISNECAEIHYIILSFEIDHIDRDNMTFRTFPNPVACLDYFHFLKGLV